MIKLIKSFLSFFGRTGNTLEDKTENEENHDYSYVDPETEVVMYDYLAEEYNNEEDDVEYDSEVDYGYMDDEDYDE